jgi:hypothetical protein
MNLLRGVLLGRHATITGRPNGLRKRRVAMSAIEFKMGRHTYTVEYSVNPMKKGVCVNCGKEDYFCDIDIEYIVRQQGGPRSPGMDVDSKSLLGVKVAKLARKIKFGGAWNQHDTC